MDVHIKDFRLKYTNQSQLVRSSFIKLIQSVSDACEEERRKLKYQEDLTERIAVVTEKINSVAIEEEKLAEEKKKVLQLNNSLNEKLKKELAKVEDLRVKLESDRTRIEEQERVAKKIQDRSDLLLKPYHEVMGVTFQHCNTPEVSLRIIFQMPNSKRCVVKLNQKGLKVVKCVPMIKGLDKLETHLAETNDYPGFVTHLRSLFFQMIR